MFATWRDVFLLTRRRPGLLLPFVILAALEFYALALLVMTPDAMSSWLNGFIARNYGPSYVPYPFRQVILPSLLSTVRLTLELVVGSLVTGWATARAVYLLRGESVGLGGALVVGARRYGGMFLLSLLSVAVARTCAHLVALFFSLKHGGAPLFPAPWGLYLMIAVTFASMTLIQSAILYTPAAMIADRLPLWRALGSSARRFWEQPATTFGLVAIPVLPFFLLSASASLAPAMGLSAKIPMLLAAAIAAGAGARWMVTLGAARAFSSPGELSHSRTHPEHQRR